MITKIYAPVPNLNGTWASVRFINSVGETSNPALVEWFKSHGYLVETVQPTETKLDEIVNELPDFEEMTPNDLREWMVANGYGSKIKNIRNKEKLLALLEE